MDENGGPYKLLIDKRTIESYPIADGDAVHLLIVDSKMQQARFFGFTRIRIFCFRISLFSILIDRGRTIDAEWLKFCKMPMLHMPRSWSNCCTNAAGVSI